MKVSAKNSVLSGILCLALAVGCATGDDPREGDFFSGVANLTTGAYQRRVDQKQQSLEAAEQERARLRAEQAAAEAERAEVGAARLAAEKHEAEMAASLDELNRRLADAESRQALEEGELRQLQQEVQALNQAQTLLTANPGLDEAAKARELQELELRKQRLEEALIEALGP